MPKPAQLARAASDPHEQPGRLAQRSWQGTEYRSVSARFQAPGNSMAPQPARSGLRCFSLSALFGIRYSVFGTRNSELDSRFSPLALTDPTLLGFHSRGPILFATATGGVPRKMAQDEDRFEKHFERKRQAKEDHRKGLPGEDDEPLPPPPETIKKEEEQPGRNDPCPCGSGKKYKRCCLKKEA